LTAVAKSVNFHRGGGAVTRGHMHAFLESKKFTFFIYFFDVTIIGNTNGRVHRKFREIGLCPHIFCDLLTYWLGLWKKNFVVKWCES